MVARPAIVRTGRILEGGRLFTHLQQKKFGLKEVAEERKAADERYRALLSSTWKYSSLLAVNTHHSIGLGNESRKNLADLRHEQHEESMEGHLYEDLTRVAEDDGDEAWEDDQEDQALTHAIRDLLSTR